MHLGGENYEKCLELCDRFRYVMSKHKFAEEDEIESQFNVERLIEMLRDKTCANSIWQNN